MIQGESTKDFKENLITYKKANNHLLVSSGTVSKYLQWQKQDLLKYCFF